jgi:UTP--glucose-1-phosphate uridylyltransferase
LKKVRKAIIPVAGIGTRFLPATKSVPKEMLPIIDKPTLHYIIEEAIESGIEEILLITSPYKKAIEDYFDRSYELEDRLLKSGKNKEYEMLLKISTKVKVYYIRQGEPNGSGHAIGLGKSFIGDEPFAVLYGDDIMTYNKDNPVLKQLIDIHYKHDANVIGVQPVPKELVNKYGIIDYENESTGKIRTIIEKPKVEEAPSNTAGLGRYIVNSSIFDIIDTLSRGAGNEYQFTDAMKILMEREPFYACKFEGTYYDIGQKIGYLKANIDFALNREDLKVELSEYIKKISCI